MSRCQPTPCCPGTAKLSQRDITRPGKGLADIAKALGHPIRLKILAILKNTNGCICGDLVDRLPISQATVSQHLKVLKSVGMIRGKISGPSTCYCLEPATLEYFKQLVQKL